jgi:hypothetical protein
MWTILGFDTNNSTNSATWSISNAFLADPFVFHQGSLCNMRPSFACACKCVSQIDCTNGVLRFGVSRSLIHTTSHERYICCNFASVRTMSSHD